MPDATLVYDDDCGFCTWWADYIRERSDLRVVGFSDLTPDLHERLPPDYEECSHLLTDDGIYSCGASIEQALVRSNLGDSIAPVVRFLRNFQDYNRLREDVYRGVANHRGLFGQFLSKTPPAREQSPEDD